LADKLNLGMDQLNHGLEVAAIERVKESPKGSDHLLVSHCPRSISRRGGGLGSGSCQA
jgi:hypothetical protein